MTNWVTIKIPEETRDRAKDDNRTYEEIMQDGLKHGRVGPLTDGEVPTDVDPAVMELQEILETQEEILNEISMANEPGVEVDTTEIIKRIEDLESRLPRKVAEELR